jgi:hypothetical protein
VCTISIAPQRACICQGMRQASLQTQHAPAFCQLTSGVPHYHGHCSAVSSGNTSVKLHKVKKYPFPSQPPSAMPQAPRAMQAKTQAHTHKHTRAHSATAHCHCLPAANSNRTRDRESREGARESREMSQPISTGRIMSNASRATDCALALGGQVGGGFNPTFHDNLASF